MHRNYTFFHVSGHCAVVPPTPPPTLNPAAAPWSPASTSSCSSSSWADAPSFVPLGIIPKNVRTNTLSESLRNPTNINSESKNVPGTSDTTEQPGGNNTPSKSWAQIVNPHAVAELTVEEAESQICPFYLMGECRYGDQCAYIHGLSCEFCDQPMLHPNHEAQRRNHQKKCLAQHEAEMEQAFAIAKSKERTCGICMEIVMDKPKGENRFGIMPNCNHCFCLPCLRKWRQAKQFENKIIR